MTQKIKQRIEQIQHGEAPDGYTNTPIGVLPSDWGYAPLSELSDVIEEQVGDRDYETLSISAGIGFVNQAAKFGKELSGNQYSKYIVLHKGDFAYNKGNSNRYPQGCTYMLKERETADVPNVFECFRIYDDVPKYYEQLFLFGFMNKQLARLINHGVRDDGLLNLTDKDFYSVILPVPPTEEQRKIAEILATCDRVIQLKQKLLDEMKKLKKVCLEKMFPQKGNSVPEIRFPGFTAPWELCMLGDVVDFLDTMRKPLEGTKRVFGPYPYYGASGIVDYVDDYIFDEQLILLSEDGANILERSYPVCFLASGKYWVNNHAHVLRAKAGNDNAFISISLEQKDYKQYNSGMAMPKLNQQVCRRIPICCPSHQEQRIIGDYFINLDKITSLYQHEIEAEQRQKKALMQLLLTGIVRV